MAVTYTIFDLETTGFCAGRDRIIQIAAIQMCNGRLLTESVYFTFVDPGRSIPWHITRLTGIRDHDVLDAPGADIALRSFAAYAGDTVLIAHNACSFDMRFLEEEGRLVGARFRPVHYHDSLELSRRAWPEERRHSLGVVKERLGLHHQHQRHDARGDVEILGAAVIKMSRLVRCCTKPLEHRITLHRGRMPC